MNRPERARRWPLLTFVVDPPTMLLAGFAFVGVAEKWVRPRLADGWLKRNAVLLPCVLLQGTFWILGPLAYWDVGPFPGMGMHNDFMWNGYLLGYKVVTDIPTYASPNAGVYNAIAIVSWLTQPLLLWLSVRLGYRYFGRSTPAAAAPAPLPATTAKS